MRKLLTAKNTFYNGLVVDEAIIYPVAVLHDPMFDAPNLNKVMNSFYLKELRILREQGLATANLKLVALMDIDTFIKYLQVFTMPLKVSNLGTVEICNRFDDSLAKGFGSSKSF